MSQYYIGYIKGRCPDCNNRMSAKFTTQMWAVCPRNDSCGFSMEYDEWLESPLSKNTPFQNIIEGFLDMTEFMNPFRDTRV